MAQRLFTFVQMELPWELGPPDGRYLLRKQAGPASGEPEHVVVLSTVGAARRGRLGRRARTRPTDSEPASVPVARATVVDAVALSAEGQARTWMSQLDPERETTAAIEALNRLLFAYRLASAGPYVHELSASQALIVRAGFGEGEQVAEGVWSDARELVPGEPRTRRASTLRPQERLAALLAGRDEALVCEELALRARADLEQRRLHHAALELERAYATALRELPRLRRNDLQGRIEELAGLAPQVERMALASLGQTPADSSRQTPADPAGARRVHAVETIEADALGPEPDELQLGHALERLEAALRARSAAGLL